MLAHQPLNDRIIACNRCPRLRTHCETVARQKRAAYREHNYWGRPVPNFGPADARLLIVGLAPAAHGANRTGRMFTGDRSGDWLFRALYKAGFASQPEAHRRDDGLALFDCLITAVNHCAPPGNKPTAAETENCRPFLRETLARTPWRVVVALGGLAWQQTLRILEHKREKFGHGQQVTLADQRLLIGCYHPSQQNTFTGRLTEPMLDDVFESARASLNRAR